MQIYVIFATLHNIQGGRFFIADNIFKSLSFIIVFLEDLVFAQVFAFGTTLVLAIDVLFFTPYIVFFDDFFSFPLPIFAF